MSTSPPKMSTLEIILRELKILGGRQVELAEQMSRLAEKMESNQKESLKMLKVCHQGYTNILKAQEFTCEKFDDCMDDCQDISNSVSNLGWG